MRNTVSATVPGQFTEVPVVGETPLVSRRLSEVAQGGSLARILEFFGAQSKPLRYVELLHPYYFHSWRLVVPRSFGREVRLKIMTGVNGMSQATGTCETVPEASHQKIRRDQLLRASTSRERAEELAREYLDWLAHRRYRAVRRPRLEQDTSELLYVPYYVYARDRDPTYRATVVEGLTGAVGRVRDMPYLKDAVEGLFEGAGREERSGGRR